MSQVSLGIPESLAFVWLLVMSGGLVSKLIQFGGTIRHPRALGWALGLFLASVYLPFIVLTRSPIFLYTFAVGLTLCFVGLSYFLGSALTSSNKALNEEGPVLAMRAWCVVLAVIYTFSASIFLLYIISNTPLFAWDSLSFWAPAAIDALDFKDLDTSGHPSFGVYSLSVAATLGEFYGFPMASLLWYIQAIGAIFVTSLCSGHGRLATRFGVSAVLLLLMPMYTAVISSVGYFDLHLAIAMLLILTMLRELRMSQNYCAQIILFTGLILLAVTILLLKTTAMISLFCAFLAVAWVWVPRGILFIGGFIAIGSVCSAIYFGFDISILERSFSLDWNRSPTLVAPGLGVDLPQFTPPLNAIENYITSAAVNQSFSILFVALLLVVLSGAKGSTLLADFRYLYLIAFIAVDFALQISIPYFNEHAAADTRFSRSLLPVALISVSLLVEELVCLTTKNPVVTGSV